MRDLGPEATAWADTLRNKMGIVPAMLAWFDFESGPVGVWTGTHSLQPTGTGDAMLDGKKFEPLNEGAPIQIGTNSFDYRGSGALTLSVAIPDTPHEYMTIASVDPSEYQARTAILWRAMIVTAPSPGSPAVWAFRRVRAGSMDEMSISNDGQQHTFSLTIEAHASMISAATGSTYLDQRRFDSADTSQDYAVSIANNPNGPGGVGGYRGGGGGRPRDGGGGGPRSRPNLY